LCGRRRSGRSVESYGTRAIAYNRYELDLKVLG